MYISEAWIKEQFKQSGLILARVKKNISVKKILRNIFKIFCEIKAILNCFK